jgi:hypothetical protein
MRRLESGSAQSGPAKSFTHVVMDARMIERSSVAPLPASR